VRTRKIFIGTLAVAAALAAPLAFAGAANAATTSVALTNAGFETADMASLDGFQWVHVGEQTLDGWTVSGPGASYPGGTGYGEGIDIVSNNRWQAAEGSRSIDLNAYNQGSISQTIDTVAGQTYDVTFALSGNPSPDFGGSKTMTVTAGAAWQDFTFDKVNTPDDMQYENKTFSFIGTGSPMTLTFKSTTTIQGPGNVTGGFSAAGGPVIDNVHIGTATNTVKTKVWNTWTGGSLSSTTAPNATDPAWHPTTGDPQSTLHKSENHKVNEPYFVPKGKSGGAWFMWSEVETTS